jgi:3-methyl-2-oxobutanoate hydroxymethyltransferase
MRTSILDLQKLKGEGRRVAMVTAYDYASAKLAERAGFQLLLVGDSLGMVMHGHDTTIPVTLDDMVRHASAVVRGTERALVVGDLPFLTYSGIDDAINAAGRMMREAGVQAVKVEGGGPVVKVVRRLVELGIPVMGHLGYTPQATHQIGIRVQGKDAPGARSITADALALQSAGAFAIVLELVPIELAEAITARLSIPTIGIGAGVGCDGQVQVWHDILGLFEKSPRHAKRFAEAGTLIEEALRSYREEVEAGTFPTRTNSSTIAAGTLAEALKGFEEP